MLASHLNLAQLLPPMSADAALSPRDLTSSATLRFIPEATANVQRERFQLI
jgi:hypothetical protein